MVRPRGLGPAAGASPPVPPPGGGSQLDADWGSPLNADCHPAWLNIPGSGR